VGARSIHASLIEGGKELSTYPDHCEARFERRTLPGEDPGRAADELEELCAELAQEDPLFDYRVSLDFTRNGYEVDRDEPVVGALARAMKKVLGVSPAYAGSTGWLDSALLGRAGIPTVIYGPAGAGAHSAVEYVSVASVVDGARVLGETIVELCGE